jgi:hypothetical protein
LKAKAGKTSNADRAKAIISIVSVRSGLVWVGTRVEVGEGVGDGVDTDVELIAGVWLSGKGNFLVKTC